MPGLAVVRSPPERPPIAPLRRAVSTAGAEVRPEAAMCGVVVLQCAEPGKRTTKLHRRRGAEWETEPYDAGTYFGATTRGLASIFDLSGLLLNLEPDPRVLLVRGKLANDRRTANRARRRYLASKRGRVDFERADRRFLCADIDNAPAPEWLDPSDPESRRQAVEWAICTYLPACFHGATVHYQWSSSAGVKPWSKLSLHLWFWLDRPACDPSLKEWLRPVAYVDDSLCTPVQPHYVAAPIFEGCEDPLKGQRSGLIEGERDEVTLPACVVDLAAWEGAERKAEAERKRQAAERAKAIQIGALRPVSGEGAEAYAQRALEGACSDVRNAPSGESNRTLYTKAFRMFSMAAAGMLSEAEVWEALDCAADARVTNEADRRGIRATLSSARSRGLAYPFDLSKLAKPRAPKQARAALQPPADDVPHTIEALENETPLEPHWPAATESKSEALARQETTIRDFIRGAIAWKQADSERQKQRERALLDAGLDKVLGKDTAVDLDAWCPKLEAERAARRDEILAELEALSGREGKRAQAKVARLEVEAAKLEGPVDVLKELKRRKGAISRAVSQAIAAKLGVKRPGRLLMTGPMGSGKTSTTIAELALIRDPNTVVLVLQPTLKKADEFATDYRKKATHGSLPVTVVRGRGAEKRPGSDEPMCPRHEAANAVARAGGSASDVCNSDDCPDCAYLEQAALIKTMGGGVFVMSHEYAFVRGPAGKVRTDRTDDAPSPDLVIVDESIEGSSTSWVEFSPDRITSQALPMRALKRADEFEATMAVVHNAVTHPSGKTLKILRESPDVDKAAIKQCASALALAEQLDMATVDGGKTDAEILEEVMGFVSKEAGKVRRMLRQIVREWDSGRDELMSVRYDPNAVVSVDGKAERQGRVTVRYRRTVVPEIGKKKPLLALDGTGELELNRRLFGDRMREVKISIERNAHVTQVMGKTFSRTQMLGRKLDGKLIGKAMTAATNADKLRREVADFIVNAPGERKLVITYKPLAEPTKLEDGSMPPWADFSERLKAAGVELAHFGKIRGMNEWEGCDTVFIVGREEPTAAALEAPASAWFAEDADPLETIPAGERYSRKERGRRMRGGAAMAEKVSTHPDPRVQKLLEQKREHEIAQGLDRLRLVHNPEPKRVYLLTSIVCDVTVDRAVRWRDLVNGGTRMERVLEAAKARGGVLPMQPQWLSEHLPELFTSTKAAARWLDKEVKQKQGSRGGTVNKPPKAKEDSIYVWGEYSLGGRGAPPRCLILLDSHDPQRILSETLKVPVAWVRQGGKYWRSEPKPEPKAEAKAAARAMDRQGTGQAALGGLGKTGAKKGQAPAEDLRKPQAGESPPGNAPLLRNVEIEPSAEALEALDERRAIRAADGLDPDTGEPLEPGQFRPPHPPHNDDGVRPPPTAAKAAKEQVS